MNKEEIIKIIETKGQFEYTQDKITHTLTQKTFNLVQKIVTIIEKNPDITVKELRHKIITEPLFKNIHELQTDSYCDTDFFVNYFTGKFGNGGNFIVGEFDPVEGEKLEECLVIELDKPLGAYGKSTFVNVGVLTFDTKS